MTSQSQAFFSWQGKFAAFHSGLMTTSQFLNEVELMRLVQQAQLDPQKLKKDMQSKDYFVELQQTFAIAKELGISGTPAFVIATQVDQPDKMRAYFLPGATRVEVMQKVIDELKRNKPSTP